MNAKFKDGFHMHVFTSNIYIYRHQSLSLWNCTHTFSLLEQDSRNYAADCSAQTDVRADAFQTEPINLYQLLSGALMCVLKKHIYIACQSLK